MGDTRITKEEKRYGLIFDGLNCANKVSRQQFERTRAGAVVGMNMTMIKPWGGFETSMANLGQTLDSIDQMSDLVTIALSTADIEQAHAEGRIAIIMGTQNCAFIENDLSLLSILYRLGFRILLPTYNEPNRFGYGATSPKDNGLTELGRRLIHEMNRLGIVIDLSHCGYSTSADAIAESTQPVIFSHANALALCDSPRNKPDNLIRAIAEKGGVTGATCWAPLLKQTTRPSIEDYLDQVQYIVKVAGIEHVSFSSDLCEGSYAYAEEWEKEFGPNGMYPSLTGILGDWWTFDGQFPKGYESLAKTTHIWDGLLARGFSEDDVEKIMGKNIMRVFYEVWGE